MEEQKKKKKIASKIVDIVLGALIVLILGLQIDMFITKNNNFGIPSLFGYSFMEVLTDSMEGKEPDSFDAGEGVVIQKKDVNDVKAGEIIAFYSEAIGYCVSHRVIEIVESPEYAGAKGSFEVSPAFEYSLDNGTSWANGGEEVALEEGKSFLTRSKEDKEHTLAIISMRSGTPKSPAKPLNRPIAIMSQPSTTLERSSAIAISSAAFSIPSKASGSSQSLSSSQSSSSER